MDFLLACVVLFCGPHKFHAFAIYGMSTHCQLDQLIALTLQNVNKNKATCAYFSKSYLKQAHVPVFVDTRIVLTQALAQ